MGVRHRDWSRPAPRSSSGPLATTGTRSPRDPGRHRVRRRGGHYAFYPRRSVAPPARRAAAPTRLDVVIDMDCGIPVFTPPVCSGGAPPSCSSSTTSTRSSSAPLCGGRVSDLGRFLERRLMPRSTGSVPTLAVSDSTVAEMRGQLGWQGAVGSIHNGTDRRLPTRSGPRPADRVVVLGRVVDPQACRPRRPRGRPRAPRTAGRQPRRRRHRARAADGLGDLVDRARAPIEPCRARLPARGREVTVLHRRAAARVRLGRGGLGPGRPRGGRPRPPDPGARRSRTAGLHPRRRHRLAGGRPDPARDQLAA